MNKFDLDEIKVFESIEDYDWGTKVIGVPHVWSKTMGEGVKIATIDTGCNVEHPNLQGKIASVFNMIEKSLDVTDGYGHGTHVAGLLVGNMTGVAPKSELHVMKVLNKDGIGMISHIMDGITNAINLEVDVLSISLGATLDLPLVLKQRIREAFEHGITIVSATGNNGVPEPHYPARMDEVIAVGGVDKDLNESLFSNGGYDVLAPSVDILSTYNKNFATMSGTSMASPLVAGAIALLISYYRKQGRELSPSEIKQMLPKGVLDLRKLMD